MTLGWGLENWGVTVEILSCWVLCCGSVDDVEYIWFHMVGSKWRGKKSEVRMPLTILGENLRIWKGYLKFFVSEKYSFWRNSEKVAWIFFFLGWDVAWQMLACKMLYKAVRGVCDLCYKEIISGLSGSVPIGGNFLNVTWMFLTQCCRSYQRVQEQCFVGSRILVTNIPTRPVFLGSSWVSGQLKSRDVASNQGSELSAAYKIGWRHCCAP